MISVKLLHWHKYCRTPFVPIMHIAICLCLLPILLTTLDPHRSQQRSTTLANMGLSYNEEEPYSMAIKMPDYHSSFFACLDANCKARALRMFGSESSSLWILRVWLLLRIVHQDTLKTVFNAPRRDLGASPHSTIL